MAKSNFIVRGGGDFSGLYKEFNKAQKQMSAFQSTIGKTMKGIGVALSSLAIGKLIKDSTQVVMSVESSMDNISRNMGESSKAFNLWVQTQSKALGMAKVDAYKYGSTFSNLLGSFSANSKETAEQTQELMKAAAIISSKTGRTYDDTANRIRSGMLGSTEAIEDLGVYTQISMLESTEAFKKFANGKSWNQLSFQVQQQIRLAAILEQTYERYGETLADTTQTRQAQFTASLKNIQLSLGQAFLPIYNAVLPALTAMSNSIGRAINTFSQFTQALFGKAKTSKTIESQATSMTDLGNATEKAGKQAKGALAGFDEINQLNSKKDEGTENASNETDATVLPVMGSGALGEGMTVSPKVQAVVNEIKLIFGKLGDWTNENIKPQFDGIFDGMLENFNNLGVTIQESWQPILDNLKENLLPFLSELGIEGSETFAVGLSEFGKNIELIVDTLEPVFKFVGKIWNDVLTDMFELWDVYGKPIFDKIQLAIRSVGEFLRNVWNTIIRPVIDTIIEVATDLWDNHLRDMFKKTGEAVGQVSLFILDLWNEGLVPILNWLVDTFGPFISKLIGEIVEIVGMAIGGIADAIGGIMTILSGVIDFIIGIFTGDWKKAWEGVKKIFKGVWDTFVGIVKVPINLIIGLVNGMLDLIGKAVNDIVSAINKLSFDVPDWIPGIGGKKFGFNLSYVTMPQIPKLARGGLITSPTLAMVGEYTGAKSNPEIVAPSDMMRRIVREESNNFDDTRIVNVLDKLLDAVKQGKVLAIDGTEFASVINSLQNESNRSAGYTLVNM